MIFVCLVLCFSWVLLQIPYDSAVSMVGKTFLHPYTATLRVPLKQSFMICLQLT